MPRSANRPVLAGALVLASVVAGCSDIYYDRRETLTFAAGDAEAVAQAVQTIDPWPPASANRNIRVDGNVVEAGIERYRTGRVIPPRGSGTSSAGYSAQQAPAAAAVAAAATASPK